MVPPSEPTPLFPPVLLKTFTCNLHFASSLNFQNSSEKQLIYTSPWDIIDRLSSIRKEFYIIKVIPSFNLPSPNPFNLTFSQRQRHIKTILFCCEYTVFCIVLLQGSYSCGLCKDGYVGNTVTGCELADYCLSGKHTCHANATCYYTGPQEYKCVVRMTSKFQTFKN